MRRNYRHAGAISVTCAHGAPAQFIWRDRLYRVDAVLQQWQRSAPWWHDVRTPAPAQDMQAWRVEASAGRHDAQGVYELGFDPGTDRWFLIRTHD